MTNHPYEYKVLIEYIGPEERGRYPHFSNVENQEGFTKTINEVFAHLPESITEGWEVNSHNITVSRNTLIVTVLLRRRIAQ